MNSLLTDVLWLVAVLVVVCLVLVAGDALGQLWRRGWDAHNRRQTGTAYERRWGTGRKL